MKKLKFLFPIAELALTVIFAFVYESMNELAATTYSSSGYFVILAAALVLGVLIAFDARSADDKVCRIVRAAAAVLVLLVLIINAAVVFFLPSALVTPIFAVLITVVCGYNITAAIFKKAA